MTKTVKTELKLLPTYDEMVGMIESQGDQNRPSIEKILIGEQHYLEMASLVVNLITLIF